MHITGQKRVGDFARRQQHHFNIGQTGKTGAIAALVLFQYKSRISKPFLAGFFQAALGGNGEGQVHDATLFAASTRSVRMAQPMALTGDFAPSDSIKVS